MTWHALVGILTDMGKTCRVMCKLFGPMVGKSNKYAKMRGSRRPHTGVRGTHLPLMVLERGIEVREDALHCAVKRIAAPRFGESGLQPDGLP